MEKVAVIILHFGKVSDTLNCLSSLKNSTKRKLAVYVIDNGTNKLQSKELKTILPQTILIKNKKNMGFSGGINVGIKIALKEKSSFILILNNDTFVKKGALEIMLNNFKNKKVGIAGPLITYTDNPGKVWFGGGECNKFFCYTRHNYINKSIGQNIKSGYTDFITGACIMVRKEVFEKCGLFDEDYFLYWEDVDFCQRAKEKGYYSYLVNKPLIEHDISSSSGERGTNKLSPLKAYYFARNPFVFMKKNNYKGLYFLTGLMGQVLIRFPYYFFTLQNFKSFKEYLRGFKAGLNFYFTGLL